jgi:hypothetical protein
MRRQNTSLRTHILQHSGIVKSVFSTPGTTKRYRTPRSSLSDSKHPSNEIYCPVKRIQPISSKYDQSSSHDPTLKAQLQRCYMIFSCFKVSYKTKTHMGNLHSVADIRRPLVCLERICAQWRVIVSGISVSIIIATGIVAAGHQYSHLTCSKSVSGCASSIGNGILT